MNIIDITITEKENSFLQKISSNEYCEYGVLGYWVGSCDFDMKVTRGIISSLIQKGIVNIHDEDGLGNVWVGVRDEWIVDGIYLAKFEIV